MERIMTVYELMIKTNHYLIKGGKLTDGQKANIVNQLLDGRSDERAVQSFKKGVKAPEYLRSIGQSKDTHVMYPLFYIPPYNDGKKFQTVIPMSPKTHILSANSYELEILRLLYFLAPNNTLVQDMIDKTISRLKTTCFGYHDCYHGECFHSALITLRFIITVSDDEKWINNLIQYFNKYNGEVKRHSGTIWYYWLCLSERSFEIAKPEIDKYKMEMLNRLRNRSCVMNSENDKNIHPVILCVLRNNIAKYAEYNYIKDRQPYIKEKDGRLYFDMSEANSI